MSDEYKPDNTPNTFGWNEIITKDKKVSVEFYTKLFGWTAESMDLPNGMSYTFFKLGDRPAAGLMVPPDDAENVQETWMSYVQVEDLDASVARAKELGADICVERVDLPMGSFAVIRDPRGASLAFWKGNEDAPDC